MEDVRGMRLASVRDRLVSQLVKAQQLCDGDRDPETEVQIVRGLSRDGSGKFDTKVTKRQNQRGFPLQNEIGNWRVKTCDEQAQA
jgi:F420-0:gamma-glutamyl ligase